jgi:hypothetical protein
MNTRNMMGRAAIFAIVVVVSALTSSVRAEEPRAGQNCGGETCEAVFRGLLTFFNRDLHDEDGKSLEGNDRSCNDCHMASDRFRLTPASAEKRFQLLQWRLSFNPNADDPLFRPIDADDFRINGDEAHDYSNLRQNGLIRVTLSLPPNTRLIDPVTNQPSAETSVDVWRKVPTVLNVKLTGPDGINPWPRGPNKTGGYQHDARFLTLQEQALGALLAHAQVQNPPPQQMLDDLNSFQRVLFSSERVRELSNAIDAGATPLPDIDPPLNALESQGKVVFTRACAQCHGGPGQSTPQAPVIRFHDIFTSCPRPVDTVTPPRFNLSPCSPGLARNVRTYEITLANGTTVRRTSSDPGRALLTGFVGGPAPQDDWNKLDTPGLRDIRLRAPYFHNNSANTLEEVVDHYIEFFKRVKVNALPGVVPPIASTDGVNFDRAPQPEERAALLAYLLKL